MNQEAICAAVYSRLAKEYISQAKITYRKEKGEAAGFNINGDFFICKWANLPLNQIESCDSQRFTPLVFTHRHLLTNARLALHVKRFL